MKLENISMGKKLSFLIAIPILGLILFAISVNSNQNQLLENGQIEKSLSIIKEEFQKMVIVQQSLSDPSTPLEARAPLRERIADIRKTYGAEVKWMKEEALPNLNEEFQSKWTHMFEKVGEWKVSNDELFALTKELEDVKITAPEKFRGQIEIFEGDHWKAMHKVERFLNQSISFEGGEIADACRMGKFIKTYESHMPEMDKAVQSLRGHHDHFHAGIRQLKNREVPSSVARKNINSAAKQTFLLLDDLREITQRYQEKIKRIHELNTRIQQVHIPETSLPLSEMIELASQDSQQVVKSSKLQMMGVLVFVIGIVAFISFIIISSLKKNVATIIASLEALEKGKLNEKIEVSGKDEFSIILKTVKDLSLNFGKIIKNLKGHTTTVFNSSESLASVSTQLMMGAEKLVQESTTISHTTEQVGVNINTMASAAEEMSVNANDVASAAEQTSQNMNAVSSAVEEMSVSIGQIAKDAGSARTIAMQASSSSETATESMASLSEAAKEIGNVTEMIKRIAEQTNLLALNATIEAASAGEAGKGFAVVANEIKELASQSAQAADDIAGRIFGVQSNTKSATEVIQGVSQVISEIDTTINNIATAVEQQSNAVDDISANVTQASTGTQSIAEAIAEVAKGAKDVSQNSGEASVGANSVVTDVSEIKSSTQESVTGTKQVEKSAQELAEMSASLNEVVARFEVD